MIGKPRFRKPIPVEKAVTSVVHHARARLRTNRRGRWADFVVCAYPRPCRLASKETGMPLSTFPKKPPPVFEAALAAALVEDEPEAE